ncbi:hypothetical protein QJS10_CPB14g00023 [Acorus calamus]|uniref:Uncharacterized protein n=1 Tax=Acorus calamus TaxID=4465 RepID=A0AAV9DC27_ACOCL|nr:hypothetical protein QJS10_CPB14g00023 [Acorus calamus]
MMALGKPPPRNSRTPPKRSSGYEPSDTESELHDAPLRPKPPIKRPDPSRRSPIPQRSTSRSPYKPNRRANHVVVDDDEVGDGGVIDSRKNISPFNKNSDRRHVSPYRMRRESLAHGNRHHRSMSVPKPRQPWEQQPKRNPSPLPNKSPTIGAPAEEINGMLKLTKASSSNSLLMQSTDSISPGDIFFSRDVGVRERRTVMVGTQQKPREAVSVSTMTSSQTNTSSYKTSNNDSGSYPSGKNGGSSRKFTANRQRSQSDTWFSCVRGRSCGKSKSPETRQTDEASFIERALVVEDLRPFWADKHQPRRLDGFICHKQQAQYLKQLISHTNYPHIMFQGPSGSGKKALSRALLCEAFGDSALRISHDLKHYHIQQEARPIQVVVPLTSSPHHVELNLKSGTKTARYALMGIIKEIAANRAAIPEISDASFKADYKAVQESVKNRSKLITLGAPVTHEIMEVLIYIAKKENFDLPMSFAAKIAAKSRQNMRRAIMALEACKAHNYPFVDEQPIPLGWEEVLVEVAAGILGDPSPNRLFHTRGEIQQLLVEFVNPKLILQKLVEEFLKGIEASLKRELYYWQAYYDKRLPSGTSALLKLEGK